jgi:hypothetical protein
MPNKEPSKFVSIRRKDLDILLDHYWQEEEQSSKELKTRLHIFHVWKRMDQAMRRKTK